MSIFSSKISELNSVTTVNMAAQVPASLNLNSGDLATSKVTLSQIRDLFDFNQAYDSVNEGVAATVKDQLFYVYAEDSKLRVNEYLRTEFGATAVINASGTKKTIYIPELLKHVKVQIDSFANLKTFKPWYEGQVVYLKGYYQDDTAGEGEFSGHFGNKADDGGIIASDETFYWERIISGNITPQMFGAKGDGIADDTSPLQKAFNAAGAVGVTCSLLPGKYLIRQTLSIQAGVRIIGSSGTLTGSARKIIILTDIALSPMFDTSNAKWSNIEGFNVDGGNIAVRAFKGTNVFGLSYGHIRVNNCIVDGFVLENDGNGIGCYLNSYRDCHVSQGQAGFVLNSSGSNINAIVYDRCSSTDTENYGFLEMGDNPGRDVSYLNCDAEKTKVGLCVRSKNFSIINPYVEYCSNQGIMVNGVGLQYPLQSGNIFGGTVLGSLHSGAPVLSDCTGISINNAINVTVVGVSTIWCSLAIFVNNTSRYIEVLNPHFGSNTRDTQYDSRYVSTSRANQQTKNTLVVSASTTIGPDINELLVSNGNNNVTVTLSTSSFLIGEGINISTLQTRANTGKVTIDSGAGCFIYGEGEGSTETKQTFTMNSHSGVRLIKQSDTTWYVFGYLTTPGIAVAQSQAATIEDLRNDLNKLQQILVNSGILLRS